MYVRSELLRWFDSLWAEWSFELRPSTWATIHVLKHQLCFHALILKNQMDFNHSSMTQNYSRTVRIKLMLNFSASTVTGCENLYQAEKKNPQESIIASLSIRSYQFLTLNSSIHSRGGPFKIKVTRSTNDDCADSRILRLSLTLSPWKPSLSQMCGNNQGPNKRRRRSLSPAPETLNKTNKLTGRQTGKIWC